MHLTRTFHKPQSSGIVGTIAMHCDKTCAVQLLHDPGLGIRRDGKNSDLHIRQPIDTGVPYPAPCGAGDQLGIAAYTNV